MQELRARQSTAIGRQDLRKRTTVEHYASAYWALAGEPRPVSSDSGKISSIYAPVAVVHNLHVIARMAEVLPIKPGIESNSLTG